MIRSITIIFLLFAVVAQSFNKSVILLDYQFNTIAFIKNCINKSKPEMQCHGKCQMNKKIQESENESKKPGTGIYKAPILELFCNSTDQSPIQEPVLSKKSSGFPLSIGQPVTTSKLIFHPPSVPGLSL